MCSASFPRAAVETAAPRVRIITAEECTYSVDEIPDIVCVLGANGRLRYVNAAGQRLLGRDLADMGKRGIELVHPDDVDALRSEIEQLVGEPGSRRVFEFRIAHANGSWQHLQTLGANLIDDTRCGCVVLHGHDVTELRLAEDRREHELLYDHLTGLPTRGLFIEHLRQALRHEARSGGTLAVFGVDINGLGIVNEYGGYDRGDALLVRVGRDLQRVLRAYDTVARADPVVARLEDAFFVLCEDVPDVSSAAAIATRLAAAVREGTEPTEQEYIDVTATVGVVLSSPSDSDPEKLLVDATSAMHVGKERGGDRVEYFDQAIHRDAKHRINALHDLRVAITENQFRLVYQPKIDIVSGQLRGVEALVRWQHPRLGIVSPEDFIPLAEETGLIIPLGEWILTEACRQRARWRPLVEDPSTLTMCVNVSGRQFNATFPDLVRRVFAETHAPEGSLCIEVTETAVMRDVEATIATLRELQDLGVQISIDDFGTGYSSLAQLKRLPLDEVKIDQSFVGGLGRDPEDTAIVKAILAMAHALDLSVAAEGVETLAQLAHLRTLGCELAQGFLFSGPVSPDAIHRLLTRRMTIEPTEPPPSGWPPPQSAARPRPALPAFRRTADRTLTSGLAGGPPE